MIEVHRFSRWFWSFFLRVLFSIHDSFVLNAQLLLLIHVNKKSLNNGPGFQDLIFGSFRQWTVQVMFVVVFHFDLFFLLPGHEPTRHIHRWQAGNANRTAALYTRRANIYFIVQCDHDHILYPIIPFQSVLYD